VRSRQALSFVSVLKSQEGGMYRPEETQRYTLAEYWKLVETFHNHKYEYIDGHVRLMAGANLAHAQIEANIVTDLNTALRETACNVYSSSANVAIVEKRIYVPDVSVSCDPSDWTRTKALESPILVVEVLSTTTEQVDRLEKLPAYKAYPTIQDILLVDSRTCRVEHYARLLPNRWQETLYTRHDDSIALQSSEVTLMVRDIYRKVYLELAEKL
jgi:Uma2 family endonuclease